MEDSHDSGSREKEENGHEDQGHARVGRGGWGLLKESVNLFKSKDPLRMAAATAFFTSFALPPILIILIQLFGFVLNRGSLRHRLLQHLSLIFGRAGVRQIRDTLDGFQNLAGNWIIAIAGFVFLVFVATTLFKAVKDSLNQLWNIRPAPSGNFLSRLLPRIRSVVLIMMAGILFLAQLAGEAAQALLREQVNELWPGSGSFPFIVLNQVFSLLLVSAWIMIVFKYLPDGSFSWKTTLAGSLFTGTLFSIGKLLLAWLLSLGNVKSIYGAAGSYVIVLLFQFYLALMFYFGASFTAVWARSRQAPVKPRGEAYVYELSKVDS